MKQAIGLKLLRRVSKLGGKEYYSGFVHAGKNQHYWADCWWIEKGSALNCDWVNYKTGQVEPFILRGELVRTDVVAQGFPLQPGTKPEHVFLQRSEPVKPIPQPNPFEPDQDSSIKAEFRKLFRGRGW